MIAELLSEDEVEKAWAKARPMPGYDPKLYRIAPDIVQALIRRDQYNICGDYGWRIEHGRPLSYRRASLEEAMKSMQHEIHRISRPATAGTSASRKN